MFSKRSVHTKTLFGRMEKKLEGCKIEGDRKLEKCKIKILSISVLGRKNEKWKNEKNIRLCSVFENIF